MRHHASVTSISWIPSEAVTGLGRLLFDRGIAHYDEPPPDVIEDLEALRDADRFRFANHLAAWIDVDDDGRITDAGYSGGTVMGSTTIALGARHTTFAAVSLPEVRRAPEIGPRSARFVQTAGGRTAVPAPRRVNHPPFVQFDAPTVWSTLALVIHPDGRSDFQVLGASRFPRHWVYDHEGRLAEKTCVADFKGWLRNSFGRHTPWGDEDSPALVAAVETALERQLATRIMRGGARPELRTRRAGTVLTRQGEPGDDVFLLLNGVLTVEVDERAVADVGPGAILGERAVLESGVRSATLRARTDVKVAVARRSDVALAEMAEISAGHHREHA